MSSESNFNPLERREWQSRRDRISHDICLDVFKCNIPSYPEAQERFRRAVENLQIAIEETDLIHNSHKYPSFIKNYKFQKSYRKYEMCLQCLIEEKKTDLLPNRAMNTKTSIRSCVDVVMNYKQRIINYNYKLREGQI
ncbi:hypothetical protein BT96DRAFT_987484 [Gymnopus androsaceus JB14]|uniref:Uncharacterized protein n=1 Tax=Gymnopus androsaceus JB14 TaxID=1447944 RepID=A0A6A4IAK9_9AGAR|nr:hypothetical protein BT96DRAFT_987484 [Gymnopus androsaceus JB14]